MARVSRLERDWASLSLLPSSVQGDTSIINGRCGSPRRSLCSRCSRHCGFAAEQTSGKKKSSSVCDELYPVAEKQRSDRGTTSCNYHRNGRARLVRWKKAGE